jgi:hypothetical protein
MARRRLAWVAEGAVRTLFVGNSYVYFNSLPSVVASLAAAEGVALETDSVAEGGMTLLGHYRSGEALGRIRGGGWDACVLQEQSTLPIHAPEAMRAATRLLADEVRRAGGRTRLLLFLTWARQERRDEQASLDETYRRVAR